MGQCPGCKSWNTFVEAPRQTAASPARVSGSVKVQVPKKLEDIDEKEKERLSTGIDELDRVLGGGIVRGSLILVGGDPGIGKSTLLLQMCRELAARGSRLLYISGEESLGQIKLRADRLGSFAGDLSFLCETELGNITSSLKEYRPDIAVVDSIQTVYSEQSGSVPGSAAQIKEATAAFLKLAKTLDITIFIVGHVTKEGIVAGPKMLEHMVDTVLYFEGTASYRILRAAKNRFGSTNEIGVFEMRSTGLCQVPNPSEYMLEGKPRGASGSVTVCAIEGSRPLLLEIQALAARTSFGLPRRAAAGTDNNRINLLIAVMEKRAGLRLSECDTYVNIAGGLKINEPSLDLGIVLAISSSFLDRPFDDKWLAFGEVGLSGEVRAVTMPEKRVGEAERLGYSVCILPKVSLSKIHERHDNIKLIGIQNIAEAIELL